MKRNEPLLRYLGVKPDAPRFEPTLYPREQAIAILEEVPIVKGK